MALKRDAPQNDWVGANALWQVQAPSGLSTDPVIQGNGYTLQHLASGARPPGR